MKCQQGDFLPFFDEDFLNVKIGYMQEPYADSDILSCFKLQVISIESISKISNEIFEKNRELYLYVYQAH